MIVAGACFQKETLLAYVESYWRKQIRMTMWMVDPAPFLSTIAASSAAMVAIV